MANRKIYLSNFLYGLQFDIKHNLELGHEPSCVLQMIRAKLQRLKEDEKKEYIKILNE